MSTTIASEGIAAKRNHVLKELCLTKQVDPDDAENVVPDNSLMRTFPDETVITMYGALQSFESGTFRQHLARTVINGRPDRALAFCRYRSLFLEGVPKASDPSYVGIMAIPERHGFSVPGSIALARRIGMAHTILALLTDANTTQRLKYSKIRALEENVMVFLLENDFSVLVETFAAHPDKIVRLHQFIVDRGEPITKDLCDQIKIYAESPTAALAEGSL